MSSLFDLLNPSPDVAAMQNRKDFRGLMKALRHRDPRVQFQASNALSALGSEGVDHLIAGLASWSKDTRLGIIEALGEIKNPKAVDPLIILLKDRDSEIRWEAALALGEIGDDHAILPLKEALRDQNRYVRYGASVSLEKLGWIPADQEEYAFFLNGKQEWESLASMGKAAIAPLSISALDLETSVRTQAIKTLGIIGESKAIPTLYRALRDSDSQVRWEAVLAAPKSGIPVKFLPRALSRRKRTRKNPYIAALLNFLIPGIGYFWLGYWWGVIIFQAEFALTAYLLASNQSDYIFNYLIPVYLVLAIHAWYLARKMPDF